MKSAGANGEIGGSAHLYRFICGSSVTPSLSELIAVNISIEEIRRFVEADSLSYLSLRSLRQAVGDHNHDFCYACYTGDYPTNLVNIEELMTAKDRRG